MRPAGTAAGSDAAAETGRRRRWIVVNEPVLVPGESVVWWWGADWRVSWWRTLGGRLLLTSQRLYFVPLIRTTSWSIPLVDIAEVAIEKRPFNLEISGLKTRLLIAGADGRCARFLVGDVDEVSAGIAGRSTKTVVVL